MNKNTIDFENGNVSTLFKQLLFPTLLGSSAMSTVATIDGIFIGHGIGANGVAAVNIVVPVYQIMSGIGLMVGVGCSVIASIQLSLKKEKIARINVMQALLYTSLFALLIIAAVLLFPVSSAKLLGSSTTLMPQVLDYLIWLMPAFLFSMWTLIGLFIIRLDGTPRFAMWCNIVPAILNALLDWLFIFPLNMGIKGAAIASAASIMVGGIMALCYLLLFAKSLKLTPLEINLNSIRFSLHNIGLQCKIGSSTMFGELTLAILVYVGNWQFMHYLGDPGVGAFGITCYYAPFFFMIGNAIAQSAQPIISYNYGLARLEKVQQARNLALKTAATIGLIVTGLFIFFPKGLVGLFVDPQNESGIIATNGFPYFGTGVLFFILNITLIGYYQSMKNIAKSTLFVFLRGFIILVPSFILLPKLLGINGMWLAMPLAESITLIIIFMTRNIKNSSLKISQA